MDTKSKNIRYSSWIKLLAVLLCMAGVLSSVWGALQAGHFYEASQGADYARSNDAMNKLAAEYSCLSIYPFTYESEQAVQAGAWLSDDQVTEYDPQNENNYSQMMSDSEQRYADLIDSAQKNGYTDEVNSLLAAKTAYQADIKKQLDDTREATRRELISQQVSSFHTSQQYLQNTQGMYYYARTADGRLVTNISADADPESFFDSLPIYRELSSGMPDGSAPFGNIGYSAPPDKSVAFVGMSKEAFESAKSAYLSERALGIQGLWELAGGVLAFLVGLAWLLYAAGRKPQTAGVQLMGIDREYLDVGFVFWGIVLYFGSVSCAYLYEQNTSLIGSGISAVLVVMGVILSFMTLVTLQYVTTVAKRLKRHEFLKHTLIWLALARLIRVVRAAVDAGPLLLKWLLQFAAYLAATCLFLFGLARSGGGVGVLFLWLLFLATQAALLVWIYKKATALKDILAGVKRIGAGDLTFRIEPAGGAPFAELACSINGIADGLNAAVEDRVKAERMKAELVTNVSHDLKTPLTSILTYIDLLKAEGLGSGNAAGYLEILDAKAKRLRELTDELFEAAKAASGSIKPKMERLDVCELLSQGLGELEDRIRDSGLDFRCSLPEEKLFILADGKLLWRVMENLLSNVIKYALPRSRVYIAAARLGDSVRVTVKNISAHELNMPPEELMERFTCGDEARSSEGSGLGLAIARSLVELQGGQFRIDIDGDLFKATVEFQNTKLMME